MIKSFSAAFGALVLMSSAAGWSGGSLSAAKKTGDPNPCQLKSAGAGIQHVIYIQFDNTHLRRDRPRVPSDLEQMPHLLNFISDNGALLTNDHTILISHTAGGILSSLTGVYPDRHVGVAKTGCDGVTTPCVYGPNEVGEINANIDTLVADQFPSLKTTFLDTCSPYAFTVHGDDAPPFYLAKKGAGGGALAQTDPVTREFERDIAALAAINPYTGATDHLLVQMADQTGMKALHMIAPGDPARNATFVLFADANYFLTDFPTSTCRTCINPLFAWNHGDIQPEIANTWLGFVGPGVKRSGRLDVWTDHTDVRPTMLELVGLSDPYVLDGRVVTEALDTKAYAQALTAHRAMIERLGTVYKQLNAPFGTFALATLSASTLALEGGDATYTLMESNIAGLTDARDLLAGEIRAALNAAAFAGQPLNEQQAKDWIDQAQTLIVEAQRLTQ